MVLSSFSEEEQSVVFPQLNQSESFIYFFLIDLVVRSSAPSPGLKETLGFFSPLQIYGVFFY